MAQPLLQHSLHEPVRKGRDPSKRAVLGHFLQHSIAPVAALQDRVALP